MTNVTAPKSILTFNEGVINSNSTERLDGAVIDTYGAIPRKMKSALVTRLTGSILAMQPHELLYRPQQKGVRLCRHYLGPILCFNASAVLARPAVASVTGPRTSTESLGFCS